MADKKDFKTVEINSEAQEELEQQIRRHRHKIVRRVIIGVFVIALLFAGRNYGMRCAVTILMRFVTRRNSRIVDRPNMRRFSEKPWSITMMELFTAIRMMN